MSKRKKFVDTFGRDIILDISKSTCEKTGLMRGQIVITPSDIDRSPFDTLNNKKIIFMGTGTKQSNNGVMFFCESFGDGLVRCCGYIKNKNDLVKRGFKIVPVWKKTRPIIKTHFMYNKGYIPVDISLNNCFGETGFFPGQLIRNIKEKYSAIFIGMGMMRYGTGGTDFELKDVPLFCGVGNIHKMPVGQEKKSPVWIIDRLKRREQMELDPELKTTFIVSDNIIMSTSQMMEFMKKEQSRQKRSNNSIFRTEQMVQEIMDNRE